MSVNLEKGQRISLEKDGKLFSVSMGLGWDMAKKGFLGGLFGGGNSIDLDASCFVFDDQKRLLETVYFGNLESSENAIMHTGDNLTGEGDGDDEIINIDLGRLRPDAQSLVFTVSSFRGQTFDQIENAYCRLMDRANGQGKELARYAISGGGSFTGMIMCILYKHNGEWKLRATGEKLMATKPNQMVAPIQAIL